MTDELIKALGSVSKDPLAFVYFAFPWGKKDTPLEHMEGPDEWQIDLLKDIRDGLKTIDEVIRVAVASGHGIGKSALVAWLILFAISTFENTKGVVTSNTDTQLKSKTWAELAKWYHMFIAKELFVYTATALFSANKKYEKTWRIDAIPWSEHNPEAFAGLHNQGRRILVVFDEASAIADPIWDVVEGAMTDAGTEIMWVCFGNPTRNSGRFRECFRRYKHRWRTRQIDSRTVKISNKKLIEEWVNDYGEDSDFVKVRVRGVFPSASDLQFISTELADAGRGKSIHPQSYNFAPIVIGVDPAWTGSDSLEIVMRQGLASKLLRSIPKNDDDFAIASLIAQFEDEYHAAAVVIDQGYGTGIYSAGKQLGRKWHLVSFAEASPDKGYLNMRAYGWGMMKEWLKEGGVYTDDQSLYDDLIGPEAEVTLKGQIKLESKESMKKRGLPSPNKGDALALTFMINVRKKENYGSTGGRVANTAYSPF